MPALEKTWRHYTATCDANGITEGVGLAGDAGETILMGGGWAHTGNLTSTSESYDDALQSVVATALDYDSGTNTQEFVMAFSALRAHRYESTCGSSQTEGS